MALFGDFAPVDSSPTMADWPRHIWSRQELPQAFEPLAAPLLAAGLPLSRLVYSPPSKNTQGAEFLLALGEGQVHLFTQGRGGVQGQVLPAADTLWVRQQEELLHCTLVVCLAGQGGAWMVDIPYPKTMEKLFLPVADLLLGLPPGFDCHAAAAGGRPAQLRRSQYALYNYCEYAFRLGPQLLEWEHCPLAPRRRSMLGPKEWPEGLWCRLQGGVAAIEYSRYRVDTTYYKAPYIQVQHPAPGLRAFALRGVAEQPAAQWQLR